jgi:hypothetical protein
MTIPKMWEMHVWGLMDVGWMEERVSDSKQAFVYDDIKIDSEIKSSASDKCQDLLVTHSLTHSIITHPPQSCTAYRISITKVPSYPCLAPLPLPLCSGRLELLHTYIGLHSLPVMRGSGLPRLDESEPDSRARYVRVIAVWCSIVRAEDLCLRHILRGQRSSQTWPDILISIVNVRCWYAKGRSRIVRCKR